MKKIKIGDVYGRRNNYMKIVDKTELGNIVYVLSYQEPRATKLLGSLDDESIVARLRSLVARDGERLSHTLGVGDGFYLKSTGYHYQIRYDNVRKEYFAQVMYGYDSIEQNFDGVDALMSHYKPDASNQFEQAELFKRVAARIDNQNKAEDKIIEGWIT